MRHYMFVGRRKELTELENLQKQKRAVLVAIKGRRRVGKSTLVKYFAQDKHFISFTGITPVPRITAQDQRDEFARQFYAQFKLPPLTFQDWSDAFAHLTERISKKPTVILFDEISWIASGDPSFIPKIKIWWDNTLQHLPNVTLVLCGSVSTWIEQNIINSTALFGRMSLTLTVEDLPLTDACHLLRLMGAKYSGYDLIKILSITGGVPWYIKQIDPSTTVEENIVRLCFTTNGLLVHEFSRIFNDLFSHRSEIYLKIVHALVSGMKTLTEIREATDYVASGTLSSYLQALCISGFIHANYTWNFKTGSVGRQSLYRLSDNYLRFYIKYIEPNLHKISSGSYADLSLSALPGFSAMMGFQFENLLLKNRSLIIDALNIKAHEIIADNPYIQKTTLRTKGCQIDYLIQTRSRNLYVCEFKLRSKPLGLEAIESVRDKIKRFSVPRGFGISPVLVHMGELSEPLEDSGYFYKTIDILNVM
jgi:AAA+ ATPase superfamily predicted ATPase